MSDTAGHTKKRKQLMLEALRTHKGLVSYASEAAGISRNTHYEWLKKDSEYAKAVDSITDYALDVVENTAYEMIEKDKNPAVTIFYLKTKGKKRGYIEKQEIEISTGDMTSLRNHIRNCEEDEDYEREY
jgi:hypothetical protein